VKALYTFEVMEEGELGFVAGDVIRLLDDQHLDWWKGEFNGSVGLFPANYVQRVERYSTPQHTCLPSTVNVFVIDELLQKLHLAQSSSQSSDFIENIEKLYERVVGQMKPIVDEYLEKVNRKEEELAALNALYCESTALHDQLVKESQIAFSVQPLSQTSSNNMSTDSLSFIS
jgi:signal transducing adaptor molecule